MKNIFLLIGLFSTNLVFGQIDMVAFGSRAAVATNMYNPAIPLEGELCFNLPLLNAYSFTSTTSFSPTDAIVFQEGYKFIDIGKMVSNLEDQSTINLKADTDPFYFGFHTKKNKGFVSVGYGHFFEVNANFSKNFLTYLGNGNAQFIDDTVSLNDENFGLNHYQKVHAGYAHHVNPKLTVGGRFNVYSGFSNFELKNFDASIFTDGTSFPAYATTADLILDARMGGMLAPRFDEDGEYEFEGKHTYGLGYGFGIDLGFQYKIDENWKIAASAKDVGGYIKWKSDYGRKVTLSGDGEISFDGLDIDLNAENIAADLEVQFDEFETELKRDFQLIRTSGSYKSTIGNQFLLSAHYKSNNKKHEVIGMLHTRDRFGQQFNQAGATYHYSPTRWIQLSAGYNWMKEAPVNFGSGITLSLGAIQFNAFTNDIPGLFNIGGKGQASVRGGINVVWRFAKEVPKIEPVPEANTKDTKKYF